MSILRLTPHQFCSKTTSPKRSNRFILSVEEIISSSGRKHFQLHTSYKQQSLHTLWTIQQGRGISSVLLFYDLRFLRNTLLTIIFCSPALITSRSSQLSHSATIMLKDVVTRNRKLYWQKNYIGLPDSRRQKSPLYSCFNTSVPNFSLSKSLVISGKYFN